MIKRWDKKLQRFGLGMGTGSSSKMDYGREYGDYNYQPFGGKRTKKKPTLNQIEKDQI